MREDPDYGEAKMNRRREADGYDIWVGTTCENCRYYGAGGRCEAMMGWNILHRMAYAAALRKNK